MLRSAKPKAKRVRGFRRINSSEIRCECGVARRERGSRVEGCGEWRTLSYVGLWTRVKGFAAGLSGFGVGDRVALMGASRIECPVADLAIQSLGAATAPVCPALEGPQVARILKTSGAKVAVAESRKLLDRVFDVRDESPELEHVVLVEGDASGTAAARFEDVAKSGKESQPTRQFADYERPKKFELLSRELSQEEGELTSTLKVKNRVARDRYEEEIRRLYA